MQKLEIKSQYGKADNSYIIDKFYDPDITIVFFLKLKFY